MAEAWQCVLAFILLSLIIQDTLGALARSRFLADGNTLDTDESKKQLVLSAPADESTAKLVFAHVIFRHGDRTPLEPYPTDPWKQPECWPEGFGQLTNIGKMQHFELGRWLRKRYSNLISTKYNSSEFYIQSTDVDRTLMSAEANLAGLFPPNGDQVWNKNLKWQPIPIHTSPEKIDILAAKQPCPAYDYALSALENSVEFQDIYNRYSYLFEYVSEHAGKMYSSLDEISYFNSTLYIEEIHHKALPEWTKKIYPSDDLTYLADMAFEKNTHTRKLARLKIGALVKEILERFKAKAEGKLNPDRSLWMYSGHDTTIANLLNAFKVFKLHCPGYASTILLEMRIDSNGTPLISIFYKGSTESEVADLLDIPGCGNLCPLDKMFELYGDILPEDLEKECKLSTLMMTYEQANIGLATGIMICVMLSTLLGLYLMLIYYRRRNYRSYLSYSPVA